MPDIDPTLRATALNAAGVLATSQGDFDAARAMHEQCLLLRQELGNSQGMAHSISNLGSIRFNLEDYPGAIELFQKALVLYRELNDTDGVALTLNNLGASLLHTPEIEGAATCFAESLAIHLGAGDAWKVAAARFNLANVALKRSNYPEAEAYLRDCITSWDQLNDDSSVSDCLLLLAQIATIQNFDARASTLLGAAARMRQSSNASLGAFDQAIEASCIQTLEERMGALEFSRCRDSGKALSNEDAVAFASEE